MKVENKQTSATQKSQTSQKTTPTSAKTPQSQSQSNIDTKDSVKVSQEDKTKSNARKSNLNALTANLSPQEQSKSGTVAQAGSERKWSDWVGTGGPPEFDPKRSVENSENGDLKWSGHQRDSKVKLSEQYDPAKYDVTIDQDNKERYTVKNKETGTSSEITTQSERTLIDQYSKEGNLTESKEFDAESGQQTRKTTYDAEGNIKTLERPSNGKDPQAHWESTQESWIKDLRDVSQEHQKSNSGSVWDTKSITEYGTVPSITDSPPRHSESKYGSMVKEQEKQLGDWVIKQGQGTVEPAELYKKALELNGGDSNKATLTAYNLLANATSSQRGGEATADEKKRDSSISENLVSLRPSNSSNEDKLGPWYHTFGVGLATQNGGDNAGWAAANAHKWHGSSDKEELAIDQMAYRMFKSSDLKSADIKGAAI